MSKQLLLNFNQDGSLSQSQSTGSAIRQGDSNGEVTLVATFQNRRNDAYVAKLHFERPDGKKQRNIVMTPSASQSNQFDYSFLSGWFFAVAGTAKVTVTITDSNGAVSAQGSYSFAVEPTQVDVVDSTISYDEAAELEGLIANSIKRAKTVTLGQNVGVAGFYAACLSYLGDSTILDGDRFVGTTTNQSLNQSTNFFGEFVGNDKMLVIAKKRTYPTPVSLTISHSVYVVSGGAQSPTVTEMVDSEKLSSLFEGTAAKKAVADQNGNAIDLTYATKAELEGLIAKLAIGYFELPSYDTDGTLDDDQAEEARKTVCFIKRGNEIFTFSKEYEGTKHFETIPVMRTTGYKQGWIEINGLDSNSPTWEYMSDDYDMDSAPTQNSPNLVTSGGVHSAVSALDAKILAVDDKVNYAIEAITKKDLYETQEATFLGMAPVPAGAMVKAYLDGFKGNSAVVNQLVNVTRSTTTTGGVTFTVNNGIVTLSGTATEDISFFLNSPAISLKANVNYLLAGCPKGGSSSTYQLAAYYLSADNGDGSMSNTATNRTDCYVYISIKSGTNTNGLVFKPQLIDLTAVPLTTAEMASVSTAKAALKPKGMDVDSYIPYNTGTLTDSKPTKLIARGKNFCDKTGFTTYSYGADYLKYNSANATFLKAGTYTLSFRQSVRAYIQGFAEESTASQVVLQDIMSFPTATTMNFTWSGKCAEVYDLTKIAFTLSRDIYLTVCFQSDHAGTLPQIEIGTEATDYAPYVAPIEYDLTMPYLKSAGSVQDESKAGGSKVGSKDLSTVSWAYTSEGGYFYTDGDVSYIKKAASASVAFNGLVTRKYKIAPQDDQSNLTLIEQYSNATARLVIRDSDYTDPTTFKTSLSGNILNYEKAQYSDFSDPISYPEIFNVYAGGSIEVVGEGCDATTKVYFYVEA